MSHPGQFKRRHNKTNADSPIEFQKGQVHHVALFLIAINDVIDNIPTPLKVLPFATNLTCPNSQRLKKNIKANHATSNKIRSNSRDFKFSGFKMKDTRTEVNFFLSVHIFFACIFNYKNFEMN